MPPYHLEMYALRESTTFKLYLLTDGKRIERRIGTKN